MSFDHDKLIAYRLGRELVREVERVLKHLPRGYAKPIDQIRRASLSITLNTAEGAGEFSANEKARFYRWLASPPRRPRPCSITSWTEER